MRIAWLALLGASVALPALAHDFWLQPTRFWVAPGESTPVSLWVGHGSNRELWDADIRRVTRFIDVTASGQTPLTGSIQQGGSGRLALTQPGMHVVALETDHAVSELPAIRFNDYLEEEGLTPAIEARRRAGLTDTGGTEIYSRRAKALVRVGTGSIGAAPHVMRPVGMTLELVPEANPYTTPANRPLRFRVYYRGAPLAGALVKLTNLAADAEPAATQRSDASGRVAFRVDRRSDWQLNVVWTRPITGDARGQFDTTFASLTFGFDRPPAS